MPSRRLQSRWTRPSMERRSLLRLVAAQVLLSGTAWAPSVASGADDAQSPSLLRANGVELHYTDRGKGSPIVFVHGALDDYRLWEPQVAGFAANHRVITYSRRYDWPNRNGGVVGDSSAAVDAADLSALMRALSLPSVHLVGHSYGGLVALWLTLDEPGSVRTLTLAEPAAFSLLLDDAEGRAAYEDAMNRMRRPAGQLFVRGQDEQALAPIVNWFAGRDVFDRIPAAERKALLENLAEWRALTLSTRPFPEVPANAIRKLRVPTLLMTGSSTHDIFKRVDAVLEHELGDAARAYRGCQPRHVDRTTAGMRCCRA